jgi:AbrB family looped-hinge helix DNA binding protein
MDRVRLSSKGQFVLPKAIRELHNWGPGTELVVIERGNDVIIRAAKPFVESSLEPADSPSVYSGKPLTIEDMDRAIAAEAGKRG